MPFKALLIDTIEIYDLVQGSGDAYNDATQSFALTATEKGRVQQLQTHEYLAMRDTITATHRLFLDYPSAIDHLSEVVWVEQNKRFRVKGTPWIVEDSKGPHHFETMVEEILGG